jgi:hypothetical protein
MQTSEEIKKAFVDDLFALIRKHHAEVTVEMETKACAQGAWTGAHLNVCMVERLSPSGERLSQFTEFTIDSCDLAQWTCL